MVTQSFMYNAISFTYPFVLTKFYAVPSQDIGFYILPFALRQLSGPACCWAAFSIPSAVSR